MLVEGRLRHARLAADRLRAGAREPDPRELRGGRSQQALALERQTHLQWRRVTAAGGRDGGRRQLTQTFSGRP